MFSMKIFQFVQDLGLCTMSPLGGLTIANPLYRLRKIGNYDDRRSNFKLITDLIKIRLR
jgi:hypothetical protein